MSRKTKINVLLPFKMVGELENLSKLGKRSEFIQKAIRNSLDLKDGFDVTSISSNQLIGMLHHRCVADSNSAKLLLIVRDLML